MLKSILNAAVNAFRAPPVPEGVVTSASEPTPSKGNEVVDLIYNPTHPLTVANVNPFSIWDDYGWGD